VKKAFLFLVLLAVLGLAGMGLLARQFLNTPPQTPGASLIVDIPQGSTFTQAANLLEREGVIKSALFFRIYGRLTRQDGRIKAGEYAMHTGWTPARVMAALVSGQVILHKLRIPEGLTWWQVADLVEQQGFGSIKDFTRAVSDQDLLKRYGIEAPSAEGFLFPETYFFERKDMGRAEKVVEAMLKSFKTNALAKLWPNGRPDQDELFKLVILASLVEKETSVDNERPMVAGVYANRLRKGMLLQCDPTIIYGLGRTFTGNIKRSHLDDKMNPYNTYQRRGLPPGPICSPGLASLEAAKTPDETNALYFVAKGDGSHAFSLTLTEHNQAVDRYQKYRSRYKNKTD
jgi:UPF0755 protein